jgi:hypothetical protein
LRAVATAALRNPRRAANRTAQDFNDEKRFTCLITQDPASNKSPRIVASPHFETRPGEGQCKAQKWYRLSCHLPISAGLGPLAQSLLGIYFAMTEHTRATHPKIIKRLKRADGHLLSLIDMIETEHCR